MNIYDISKKANVSIATVSRVINNHPRVSPETRSKVLAVIEEYNYKPNLFARGLGTNSMRIIGIMCADSSDPYLAQGISYLEQSLRAKNYDALLCCTGYDLSNKAKYLNLLLEKRVDGIILVGSSYVDLNPQENAYIIHAAKSIPIMIINAALAGDNIFCALCDDQDIVYNITHTSIKAGYDKPLFVHNRLTYSGFHKFKGFQQALEYNALPYKEEMNHMFHSHDPALTCVQAALESIYMNYTFNAVIAANDSLAIGALKFAKNQNLSIPKDLIVIGYNNSSIAEYGEPELSSVDNKLENICQATIDNLMTVLDGKSVPQKIFYSGHLVERKSTDFSSSPLNIPQK